MTTINITAQKVRVQRYKRDAMTVWIDGIGVSFVVDEDTKFPVRR